MSEPYTPGKLSDFTVERGLNLMNQIRYIAGINANLENYPPYSEYAQAGTLLNCLNGVLTHYPGRPDVLADSKYDDLYELGSMGCSSSNIAYGYSSLNDAIIRGWMHDGDSSNIDRVGHRRWILNPVMKYTGFGKVGIYSAMYAFNRNNEGGESRVAWPAQVTPVQYFDSSYPWSISMGYGVTKATTSVTLTRKSDGKVWNFSSESSDGYFNVDNGGYGLYGCVIFRPSDLGTVSAGDSFDIEVSLDNGETVVAYSVAFFTLDTGTAPIHIFNCYWDMADTVKGYGGSSLTPAITLSDRAGNLLQENADYTITYNTDDSGFVKEAVVTGINHYTGSRTIPITRVIYEMNGGNEADANPIAIVYGENVELKNPVRDGYIFQGWYDNPECEGPAVATLNGNGKAEIRVYAKWKKIIHYTVQYDANGGTGGPGTVTGDGVPAVDRSVPERAGYDFEGWSTNASAQTAEFLPGAELPEQTSICLYAVWALPKEIDTASNAATADARIVYGGQVRQFTITPVSDAAYTIESTGNMDTYGYLYDADMNLLAYNDDGGENRNFRITATLKGGQTYYLKARFYYSSTTGAFQIQVKRPAAIIYDANGGQGAPESVDVSAGDSITLSDVIPTRSVKVTYNANGGSCSKKSATKKAEFIEWNTAPDGSGDSYAPGGQYSGTESETGDVHLYAIWKMPTMGTLPIPTYGQREFLGWYKSLTGTTKVTSKTTVSKNMTIYARWSKLLEIIDQPEDVSAGIDDKISFHVNAADVQSYKWQYSKDGNLWSSSTISSASTDTLAITVSETNAVNFYRCKLTGEDGKVLYTDAVKIQLLPGAVITSQPVSVAAKIGDSIRYTVKADNVKNAGYQWYYSKDGSTWNKSTITSASTDTLIIKASASNKDNIYRCTITGLDGRKIKSSKAGMVIVNAQPVDAEVAVGKAAAFSVSAEGIASYQWYYSKDQLSWNKSTLTSAVTSKLSLKVSDTNKNNYYRCKLTAENGISVYTTVVRVVETSVIKITAQPVSVTAASGAKVSFRVAATGVASYQWQYSKDGSSWKNSTISSASTAELKMTVADSNKGNRYRCMLVGTDGSVRYTDVVSVK